VGGGGGGLCQKCTGRRRLICVLIASQVFYLFGFNLVYDVT
jgi:hypothetical protein